MKKILTIIMFLGTLLSLTACKPRFDGEVSEEERYRNFMSQWSEFQSVITLDSRVETDEDGNRILMTDIHNSNLEEEISDIVVSFAGWDVDGNFVTIKSKNNPNNTQSEFQMVLNDVTILPRKTWKAVKGIYLDDSCVDIEYVKAAIISYKKDGKEYTNDLYYGWKENYLDKSLTGLMRELDKEYDPIEKFKTLNKELVSESAYVTASSVYKNSENGDIFLTANVKNNSDKSISSISVAFAAWDIEGNPIIIKSASGLTEDSYIKEMNLGDKSIVAKGEFLGDTKDNVYGLRVKSEQTNISYVKAIVISYTNEDGGKWTNPLYTKWKNEFSGKLLEDWMK